MYQYKPLLSVSLHRRRLLSADHGRASSTSPRPANSFSANLPFKRGSPFKMSRLLLMVDLIAPVCVRSNPSIQSASLLVSAPEVCCVAFSPVMPLKSFTAAASCSRLIVAHTALSLSARVHIAAYDGSLTTGVSGVALSSMSPYLCRRTRSKALTSLPLHGSVA